MDTPRQKEPFFAEAERIRLLIQYRDAKARGLTSCKDLFQLDLQ
jgi:hypothetical protein